MADATLPTSPSSGEPVPREEITEDTLLPLLRTRRLGHALHAFRECESTNGFARRLLSAPRPPAHGTLIIADYQRSGYGRHTRAWQSPPGMALLFSLILYPDQWPQPGLAARATMAASLAVLQAASAAGAQGCSLKWPNDILCPDGRKISGILTEQVSRPDGARPLITGIGINVNQAPEDFPAELRASATSLRVLLGHPLSRLHTLKEFLESMEALLEMPDAAIFEAWQRQCLTLGRTVRVRLHGRAFLAQALALEKDGGLILRHPSGHQEVIHSGDVEEARTVED